MRYYSRAYYERSIGDLAESDARTVTMTVDRAMVAAALRRAPVLPHPMWALNTATRALFGPAPGPRGEW